MRQIILLLILCFSGAAAERLDSFSEFAKELRGSYEKKDGAWMLGKAEKDGVPVELVAAREQLMRSYWGVGNLKVTSVDTFAFGEYTPTGAPGEFQGRKLRFVGKPTHWVVLRAASPKAKAAEEGTINTQVKLEFAVFQKDGAWRIAGATYAD